MEHVTTDTTTTTAPKLVSLKETAEKLGIKRTKLQAMLRDGEIRGIHIGRRHLIPEGVLKDFVADRMTANA